MCVLSFSISHAQKDQDSDTLAINGLNYTVTVDRNVPSVVSVWFQRTGKPSPFNFWSSSNSRGHIAKFEVLDNSLYLLSVEAKRYRTRMGNLWTESGIDTVVSPDYFYIKPIYEEQPIGQDYVVCDWFSGVLELTFLPADKKQQRLDEAKGHRYLLITDGRVEKSVFVSNEDRNSIDKGVDNHRLKPLYEILSVRKQSMDFYNRCAYDRERVLFGTHEGLFEHRANSLTLFTQRYGNDPKMWDSDWIDAIGKGAPFGTWLIRNDSLLLVSVNLHKGEDPYRYDSVAQNLFEIMAPELPYLDGTFLADWISGDYVVHYGLWQSNSFGLPDYTVSKTQKLRIKNGVILSSSFSPSSFDEDSMALAASHFPICNESSVYSVDDRQLAETVGNFRKPKANPAYKGEKGSLRTWFLNHPLTDQRAQDRLFRVRIAFIVNCKGEAGNWQVISKGKGELFEFANMVMEIVKKLPQRWTPATDKKGNPVDCWQILEFTVSNGSLTNANYK